MKLSAQKITEMIAESNNSSTADAARYFEQKMQSGKASAVLRMKISFLKTFIQNKNRSSFKDRLIYSAISSFKIYLKDLKLLKLNNKF